MLENFRTILVPHDLSDHATRALSLAASLAGARGHLIVLHATAAFGNELAQRRAVTDARRALLRVVARTVPAREGLRVTIRVVAGDAYRNICQVGRGTDCIVMCTAGRTGLRHLLIGSVAEKVVRHAPVPVLTFRPGARLRGRLFRSVLVPHDLSASASEALRAAIALVGKGGRVRVIYVVSLPPEVARMARRLVASDRARLTRQLAREASGAECRVDCRVVAGDPYRRIVQAARGVDSIVMSTLGRTGLEHLVIGSVAEKVVRHAPVPVLTLRPAPMTRRRRP